MNVISFHRKKAEYLQTVSICLKIDAVIATYNIFVVTGAPTSLLRDRLVVMVTVIHVLKVIITLLNIGELLRFPAVMST